MKMVKSLLLGLGLAGAIACAAAYAIDLPAKPIKGSPAVTKVLHAYIPVIAPTATKAFGTPAPPVLIDGGTVLAPKSLLLGEIERYGPQMAEGAGFGIREGTGIITAEGNGGISRNHPS
jgi:hypothetical protein